jgi:hypothetical protein
MGTPAPLNGGGVGGVVMRHRPGMRRFGHGYDDDDDDDDDCDGDYGRDVANYGDDYDADKDYDDDEDDDNDDEIDVNDNGVGQKNCTDNIGRARRKG